MKKRNRQDVAKSLQQLGGLVQNRTIELELHSDREDSLKKLKALASEPRLKILEFLSYPHKFSNLTEISEALNMNLATVTMHINLLEEAGLIVCEHLPGERGMQRLCGCFTNWINIHTTPKLEKDIGQLLELSMPVGAYFDFEVTPTCGLFSEESQIGSYDNPDSFYEVKRIHAQLLWFFSGYVEYRFPNHLDKNTILESLSLSMELCSEAPGTHPDWPSDISVWINDIDIGHWTSPADFGGVRGLLTPTWQSTHTTQFGLLKTWQVTMTDSQVDGEKVSDTTLEDLKLQQNAYISVKIGVKEDAKNVGGINIFGEKFGNHPQDIVLRIRHHRETS